MEEKQFVDGMIAKAPRENAPEFVKGALSIKVEEFVAWLGKQQHDGWINIDIKESRGGKWYAERNTFKKKDMDWTKPAALQEEPKDDIDPSDIPF